jgi:hypothetical protein
MLGEARAQRVDFLLGRERVVRHRLEQVAEAHRGEFGALQHERLLLALVLQRGLHVQVLGAIGDERRVLLEELRQVEILPAVVDCWSKSIARMRTCASSKSGVRTKTKL